MKIFLDSAHIEDVKKAYDMLCFKKGEKKKTAQNALEDSYRNNVYDEFVEPTIIGEGQEINSNDSVIFFNYNCGFDDSGC